MWKVLLYQVTINDTLANSVGNAYMFAFSTESAAKVCSQFFEARGFQCTYFLDKQG